MASVAISNHFEFWRASLNSGDSQYVRRHRLLLRQVVSLIFGRQINPSRHWINTQTVRFHVGNSSMKEFMRSIEIYIIRLLHTAVSVCIRMQTKY